MVEMEKIEQALARLHAEMEVPECHGVITGLLVARGQVSDTELLAAIAPGLAPGDVLAGEAKGELLSLLQVTQRELSDSDCDFNPLLPGEEYSLDSRIYALSEWVQGFLMGMAQGGIEDYSKLPDEAEEFVEDLVEMARVTGYELEDDDDENEASYMELVEYLRTGILLMNELMHPTLAPPVSESPTLH